MRRVAGVSYNYLRAGSYVIDYMYQRAHAMQQNRVNEIKQLITEDFNRIPNGSFSYPALEFEQETGLQGLGRSYIMPDGISGEELQNELRILSYRRSVAKELLSFAEEQKTVEARGFVSSSYILLNEDTAAKLKYYKQKYPDITLTDLALTAKETEAEHVYAISLFASELQRLNPELKELQCHPGNIEPLVDIVWGVISGFNLNDIRTYSLEGKNGVVDSENLEWQEKKKSVEMATGARMYWVPSMETLDNALEQIVQCAVTTEMPKMTEEMGGWARRVVNADARATQNANTFSL